MTTLTIPVACDVCHEPTHQIYFNPLVLGRDDVCCHWCFLEWYHGGLVEEAQIRRASLQHRYEEEAPCPC